MPYITRALVWGDDLECMTAPDVATTVHEAEPVAEFTGILDATGNRIYRTEDRQPIGFRLSSVRA